MTAGKRVLPEREIETILRDEVKRHGGHAYKFVSPGTKGVPDRIVCLPCGKLFFVELKRDGEMMREDQRVQLQRLIRLGQDARVVAGLNGLMHFFRALNTFTTQDWTDSLERVQKRMNRGEL